LKKKTAASGLRGEVLREGDFLRTQRKPVPPGFKKSHTNSLKRKT